LMPDGNDPIPVLDMWFELVLVEMPPSANTVIIQFLYSGAGYEANITTPASWTTDLAQIADVVLRNFSSGKVVEGTYLMFNLSEDCMWNHAELRMIYDPFPRTLDADYGVELDMITIRHGISPVHPSLELSAPIMLNDTTYQLAVQNVSYPCPFELSFQVFNMTAGLDHHLTFEQTWSNGSHSGSRYHYSAYGATDEQVEAVSIMALDINLNGRLDRGDIIRITFAGDHVNADYRLVVRYGYGLGEMCTLEWHVSWGSD
ncbi:MAG TPA: hypothetical protein VLH13_01720, partial [Methanomassiliicoccales archaeon]|nr:hypothetical protein [Methanomassiliicoccales archaeon]